MHIGAANILEVVKFIEYVESKEDPLITNY
jgi:hypothetical protein